MTSAVTFVIPVFNEGSNLATLWHALTAAATFDFQAVVVYDLDDDTTLPYIRQIAASDTRLRALKNPARGVANALKAGFAAGKGTAIIVLMADMSDDLSILPRMLELHRQGYDVVAGSRYMPGGRIVNGPVLKQALSRLAGLSLHYLRGIPTTDASNAFKLYGPRVFERVSLKSAHGFEINVELTVKAFLAGCSFAEIPAVWTERVQGVSNFKLWKWLPKYLRWYLYAFTHTRR